MWILTGAQREVAAQVFEQNLLVWMLANGGANSLVNSQLILLLLLGWQESLLLGSKNVAFATVLGLLFLTLEVSIVDVCWDLDLAQVNTGLCGNNITLRNATQWARVEGEWSGNQEESGVQNLSKRKRISLIRTMFIRTMNYYYYPNALPSARLHVFPCGHQPTR